MPMSFQAFLFKKKLKAEEIIAEEQAGQSSWKEHHRKDLQP